MNKQNGLTNSRLCIASLVHKDSHSFLKKRANILTLLCLVKCFSFFFLKPYKVTRLVLIASNVFILGVMIGVPEVWIKSLRQKRRNFKLIMHLLLTYLLARKCHHLYRQNLVMWKQQCFTFLGWT